MTSMYALTVPVFSRHLTGLKICLEKTHILYTDKKYDESALLKYRLFPDMFNFVRQVQASTDHARNCVALLSSTEALTFEAEEQSIAALIGRVDKSLAFVQSIKPEELDGTEDKEVIVRMRDREVTFRGIDLLLNRSMPNFYFHTTTAYNIMRHNGVEVGKRDFMGAS